MTFIRSNITIRKNVPFKVLLQYANEPPEPACDEDIKEIAKLAQSEGIDKAKDDAGATAKDASGRLTLLRLLLQDILSETSDGALRAPRTFEGQVVDPDLWDKVNELLPP